MSLGTCAPLAVRAGAFWERWQCWAGAEPLGSSGTGCRKSRGYEGKALRMLSMTFGKGQRLRIPPWGADPVHGKEIPVMKSSPGRPDVSER